MSIPLTKAEIVARFNSLVANSLNPPRESASWHIGSLPTVRGTRDNGPRANPEIKFNVLGPRQEPVMDVSDLTDNTTSQFAASLIFSALHRFAMQYTRVRRGETWYRSGTAFSTARLGTTQTCAFRADLAVTITIPNHPIPGNPVSLAALDNFLNDLRTRVNQVRSGEDFTTPIISCHNSCHNDCHSSRGRR